MYLQKVISKKNLATKICCWRLLGGHWRKEQDPDLDPLVRGTDPQIRIRTKMSRIQNTASNTNTPDHCSESKLKILKQGFISYSRLTGIQPPHFQAIIIWVDSPCKKENTGTKKPWCTSLYVPFNTYLLSWQYPTWNIKGHIKTDFFPLF
jgi:hypothetical protein